MVYHLSVKRFKELNPLNSLKIESELNFSISFKSNSFALIFPQILSNLSAVKLLEICLNISYYPQSFLVVPKALQRSKVSENRWQIMAIYMQCCSFISAGKLQAKIAQGVFPQISPHLTVSSKHIYPQCRKCNTTIVLL